MRKWTAVPRLLSLLAVGLAAGSLWGCPNPNAIGVQQFGSVKATCVQASNGAPVNGAIVSVGGRTSSYTDATGTVVIDQVPVGSHPITAEAVGLHGADTVTVIENQTVPKQVVMSPT